MRVGRAIALALADAGMDVAITYHRSAGAARRVAAGIERRGGRAVTLRADLADPRAAARGVERAAAALGGLDVLVNNAALFIRTPLPRVTPAQWDALFDLNVRAVFFCSQAAARVMRAGGHIVNIGDVGADRSWPGYVPYTVSKAAVAALTRALGAAWRSRGIAVNCVAPGPVLRPPGFPLARWRAVTRGRPVPREAVAAAVVHFATCPTRVTGRVRHVRGGRPR